MKRLLILILLSGALLAGGCESVPEKHTSSFRPGEIPVATRPGAAEISKTRRLLFNELAPREEMKLTQAGPSYRRVKRIVGRLSRAAGLGSFSYPVYLADIGDQVNAFAYQGNTIIVSTELVDRLPRDDELAAVLGHEMAHILGSHHENEAAQQTRLAVGVAAVVIGAIARSEVSSTAGRIAEYATGAIGTGYFVRPYDRGMEYEADHVGMLLMAKAGYDPEAAIRLWSKAGSVMGSAGASENFLSTHPSHGNRMQRLRNTLPLARRYYRKS
ncbi:MAG: M48 family metallopeptidase [Gammaproteobacteria bacterium]|jgi:metalloendopeptidase OMA1, mitochondrial